MKKLVLFIIIFAASVQTGAMAMSSGQVYDGALPDGMTSYQMRIMGGNWLNFQGMVAYYDKDGSVQTKRIFGNTPYIYNFQSKGGVSAYFRVSNMQPVNRFGGIFRVLLFKGDIFAGEQRAFITNGEVSLTYGKYPDINLEFMVPPVGMFD